MSVKARPRQALRWDGGRRIRSVDMNLGSISLHEPYVMPRRFGKMYRRGGFFRISGNIQPAACGRTGSRYNAEFPRGRCVRTFVLPGEDEGPTPCSQ